MLKGSRSFELAESKVEVSKNVEKMHRGLRCRKSLFLTFQFFFFDNIKMKKKEIFIHKKYIKNLHRQRKRMNCFSHSCLIKILLAKVANTK